MNEEYFSTKYLDMEWNEMKIVRYNQRIFERRDENHKVNKKQQMSKKAKMPSNEKFLSIVSFADFSC